MLASQACHCVTSLCTTPSQQILPALPLPSPPSLRTSSLHASLSAPFSLFLPLFTPPLCTPLSLLPSPSSSFSSHLLSAPPPNMLLLAALPSPSTLPAITSSLNS